MNRRFGARMVAVTAVLSLLPATTVAADGGMSRPATPLDPLEQVLPTGARQLLGAIRVMKGLGARNRVYREAGAVQDDLRGYYDALIETAQRQLVERDQMGLYPSQVRAYGRVVTALRAERDAALAITEDEKRAAKFGFESTLKTELTEAVVRVPRIRAGLARARDTLDELQGAFRRVRSTIEGSNPVTGLLAEVRQKLDRLDRFAALGSMINGRLGGRLATLSSRVRSKVDRVEQGLDAATGAADAAIGELDDVSFEIDRSLEDARSIRADEALEGAALGFADRVLAPRGPAPEREVLADTLARDQLSAAQRAAGAATGAIDPADFRRMRDRVHAALLRRSSERIGDICGRLTGAVRRLALDAAAAGQPAPDTSTPCTLFGDPEALQEFIDAHDATTVPGSEPEGGTNDLDEPGAADPGSSDEIVITEFEYPMSDFVWSELGDGYLDVRIVFSVDGDRVRAELNQLHHHAWVVDQDGSVECWADTPVTFAGEAVLARSMTIELVLVEHGESELTGALCAEFPFDYDEEVENDEGWPFDVEVGDDGTLSGQVTFEGTVLLEFG